MASESSVAQTLKSATVSNKPWWLTFFEETKEVFIWKNGRRLQIGDGTSAGPTKTVSVEDAAGGVLLLEGEDATGSKMWRYRCKLEKFESSRNDFTQQLGKHSSDPLSFCNAIQQITGTAVRHNSMQERESSPELTVLSKPQKQKKQKKKRDSEHPGPSKKQKLDESTTVMDKEIMTHYIGTFSVSTDLLRDPPEYLRARDVKEWYVNYLVDMMNEESGDHEDLTAPLLVICSVGKEEYKQKASQGYTYQVIGGIQRFTAISKINATEGSRKITTRQCAVYGQGLSREALLVLAQQHNRYNQIQRSTTFLEIAASCRRLMFEHFGEEGKVDDGEYDPPVPRYNTQKYREWRKECMTLCETPQVSEAYVLQAIQMALQPSAVFHKMECAFSLYEEGKLKGQKERKMSEANIRKALDGQFSPKLQHFKIFQGLKNSDKLELLESMCNGLTSMEEAAAEAKEIKQTNAAKEAFTAEVGFDSWEEAASTLPEYASKIKAFKGINHKSKQLPSEFKDFCLRAKLSKSQPRQVDATPEEEEEVLVINNNRVGIVRASPTAFAICVPSLKSPFIVFNSKGLCNAELAHIIKCVSTLNKEKKYTMLVRGEYNLSELQDVTAIAAEVSEGKVMPFTICTTQTEWHEGQEGDIGKAEFGVLVYSQPTLPSGHFMTKGNAVCVSPVIEETQCSSEPLSWLTVLMTELKLHRCCVVDIYSECGELAQIAALRGLDCTIIQPSSDRVQKVCGILTAMIGDENDSLGVSTTKGKEDEQGNDDIEESDVEVKTARKFQSHKTKGKGARQPSKYVTRSKGTDLCWSKSLSRDDPLDCLFKL